MDTNTLTFIDTSVEHTIGNTNHGDGQFGEGEGTIDNVNLDGRVDEGQGAPVPAAKGNELFDAYLGFAKDYGAETDPAKLGIDPAKMTMDELHALQEKHMVTSWAKRTGNDALLTAYDSGMDFGDYAETYRSIQEDMAAKDDQLFLGQQFLKAQEAHEAMGMSLDDIAALYTGADKDTLTAEQRAQKHLSAIASKNLQKLTPEQLAVEAGKIREGLNKELEALGAGRQAKAGEAAKKQMEDYTKGIDAFVEAQAKALQKKDSVGIIPFDGEADKGDLMEYYKKQMAYSDIEYADPNGNKLRATNLQLKLQDPETLLEVLNYLRMKETGRLTNLKNSIQVAAQKKLGIHSYVDKGNMGGGKKNGFVDTSKEH